MDDTAAPEEIAGDDVPDRSIRRSFWFGVIVASAVFKVTVSAAASIAAVSIPVRHDKKADVVNGP
jgi:hypothetical protein